MSEAGRADLVVALLTEIRNELRIIRRRLPAPPPRTATDEELNGERGDPVIKFQPKSIPSTVEVVLQKKMSQLSIPTLETLVRTFEYFAEKQDDAGEVDAKGRPKSMWSRNDAALARGWIARKRSVRTAVPRGPQPPKGSGDAWEEEEQKPTGTEDDY